MLWKWTLVILIAVSCSSCSLLLSKVFGISDERNESIEYQREYLLKNKIDTTFIAVLKPGSFPKLSSTTYSLDTFNHQGFTPIQFRVYSSDGKFYSGWEQCFGNPKRIRFYDNFPQKAPSHWPLNKNITIQRDLDLLSPVNFQMQELISVLNSNSYDYVVVGFWAGYLGGLSKTMMKNLSAAIQASDKRILFIKVNLGAGE